MRCDKPYIIRNKFLNKYMKVGCRKCDSCRIAAANAKSLLLANELSKGWMSLFITLTYDNIHLPVVFDGDNKIVRLGNGNFDLVESLDYKFDFPIREPFKYPYADCTAVIYYKDVQNFLKRFRINLYRYGKENGFKEYVRFRFFAVCEYGSVHKRPHYHLIMFFRPSDFGSYLEDLVVKSWRMCDRAVLRNGIKVADGRVSSYLAAYVNSLNRNYPLANDKVFGEKTHRSACFDYGCSTKDKECLKRSIIEGIFSYTPGDVCRPFEYVDNERINSFAFCTISERVFCTYFRKPFGFSNLSFDAFCLRARNIYFFSTKIKGRLDNLPFSYSISDYFRQADFNFYRGFLAYLELMGYENTEKTFEYYLYVFWKAYSFYNSLVLYRYMQSFEVKSKEDYFLDAYNSECVNPGSSSADYFGKLLVDFEVEHFDQYSKETYRELKLYKFNYGKRLLPKHLSSIYNQNF